MKKIIEIKEEVKIGNVILEKGDKIGVINEVGSIKRSSILPIKTVNMLTGKNLTIGNIYDTWNKGTIEFWNTERYSGRKIIAIYTSNRKPLFSIGDLEDFKHYRTDGPLFKGKTCEMVDFCSFSDLSEKGPEVVGKSSVNFYVYK